MARSSEIETKILGALRHGPLCVEELVGEVEFPEFTVEAFLKDLRRKGLVEISSWVRPTATWRLTTAGDHAAAAADQLRLA
jgi:predicted ArsR family transcriptional regulator